MSIAETSLIDIIVCQVLGKEKAKVMIFAVGEIVEVWHSSVTTIIQLY